MSKAVKCPICEGKGKAAPEGMWAGSPDSYPTCHGCDGKGWVEVGDYEQKESWPWPPLSYTITDSGYLPK